jgi:lipopolysaccharide transport system permease protein
MEKGFVSEIVIEAGGADRHYWRDVWRYRELLGFLAWRDLAIRYKQTVLGVAWALLQPIVTVVVFTIVFGRIAGMPSGGVPYPLLVIAGVLPWQLFSAAFSGASGSLVGNAHLISKVYFPRLLIPLASLAVALVDFLIVFGLWVAMALFFGVLPTWRIVLLPLYIALALGLAFGAGMWMTALTVRYRDFRFVVPFLLQAGVFLSPVGFSTTNMPTWRVVYSINPLAGIIDGFRWCLLGDAFPFFWPSAVASVAITIGLVLSGLWFFRRAERKFADII